MKRLAAILALTLTSCSTAQTNAWLGWYEDDPEAAVSWAINRCGDLCTEDTNNNGRVEREPVADEPEREPAQASGGRGSCSQWYSTAIDAGFSDAQWDTVSYIMRRESNCEPDAYNPSGASGLMQIMPMWANDCGGSPDDLFSPWFNLHCARQVLRWQGWDAWSTY
jgi:hypothetical protein